MWEKLSAAVVLVVALGFFGLETKKALQKQGDMIMAEAYRSRTYLGHHCPTPVLKTGRHTGDETLPFADSLLTLGVLAGKPVRSKIKMHLVQSSM